MVDRLGLLEDPLGCCQENGVFHYPQAAHDAMIHKMKRKFT